MLLSHAALSAELTVLLTCARILLKEGHPLCPAEPFDWDRLLALAGGYGPQYDLTPAQETAYLRHLGQISLEAPGRAVVELHATLAPRAFPFDLDLARMWPRRRSLTLSGQPVAAPSAEDVLLILCMHGA